MNFDEYDGCLCGGVPAVWPRPPRWPTDQAFESALTASLPGDLGKVFTTWILESYKRQRMMDIAWVHFNHLREKYATDGILRTIPEWVELLCVPSGWDGEPLLRSGRGGPDPLQARTRTCSASDFAFLYRDWMALAPNAASISRRSLQRKCDYCKTPTVAECGLCGEACCSRACMLKLGKDHRRECEMVHENGGNIACVLTTFEMKDGLTPEEFKAATGDYFRPIGRHARGSDESRKGKAKLGWDKICAGAGCKKNGCAMKCSKCRAIYYCGRECQNKDWKTHKKVCAQMAVGKVASSFEKL
jgi:hypothetical protein